MVEHKYFEQNIHQCCMSRLNTDTFARHLTPGLEVYPLSDCTDQTILCNVKQREMSLCLG